MVFNREPRERSRAKRPDVRFSWSRRGGAGAGSRGRRPGGDAGVPAPSQCPEAFPMRSCQPGTRSGRRITQSGKPRPTRPGQEHGTVNLRGSGTHSAGLCGGRHGGVSACGGLGNRTHEETRQEGCPAPAVMELSEMGAYGPCKLFPRRYAMGCSGSGGKDHSDRAGWRSRHTQSGQNAGGRCRRLAWDQAFRPGGRQRRGMRRDPSLPVASGVRGLVEPSTRR